jgi:hypothetical protein
MWKGNSIGKKQPGKSPLNLESGTPHLPKNTINEI